MQTTNYQELSNYLDHTDSVEVTADHIANVLSMALLTDTTKKYYVLDVGCSDGRLTNLIGRISNQLGLLPFSILAIDPEQEAIENFRRNKSYKVDAAREDIQSLLQRNLGSGPEFDYIQFAQSWYHFPREDWSFILYGALSLLKQDGLISIILDSEQGEIYSLKNRITKGQPETLEYGDFVFAEDIQRFLDEREIQYSEFSFPVTLKGNRDAIARSLAFLYRTDANRILGDFTKQFGQMLDRNKVGKGFAIENQVKSFWIRKQ